MQLANVERFRRRRRRRRRKEEEEEEGFTLTFRSLAVKEIIAHCLERSTVSEKLTPPH